jgi:hypothetical protein
MAQAIYEVGNQLGQIGKIAAHIREYEAARARRYAPTQTRAMSEAEFNQETERVLAKSREEWAARDRERAKKADEDAKRILKTLDDIVEKVNAFRQDKNEPDLKSSPETKTGELIRQYVKREIIRESSGYEKDEIFWELILEADQQSSDRLLNRAIKYYQYRLGGTFISEHRSKQLPPRIQSELGLGPINANTFEGSEIIEVAQELDKYEEIFSNEYLKLHAAIALKTAQECSLKKDYKRFFSSIDRAWEIVDYAKGVVTGLKDFAYDTVHEVAQLVFHPIDSTEALYEALTNYDKTFDAIYSSLNDIWNNYDGYSVQEKGILHAKIAGEILAAFFPVGGMKKMAQVAKTVETVVSDVKKLERIGKYFPAPEHLNVFPNTIRVKSKSTVRNSNKLRRRWKDADGKIYEWDHQHGRIEVYNPQGKHLGEFDAETGVITKQADPGRRIEP